MKVIEKIQLEKGEHFLAINEDSNTMYVSNSKSNSITVIDCISYKITNRIEIECPRKMVVNSTENNLFVINDDSGSRWSRNREKISKINTISNKIIDSIGEKEGFDSIDLNKETNVVYATQSNSKRIWVIDGHTCTVLDKIKLDVRYKVLTIDSKANKIFLGGKYFFNPEFAQINLSDKKISKILTEFDDGSPEILFFSNTNNKLFFSWFYAGDENDNSKTWVAQIDLRSNLGVSKIFSEKFHNTIGFDSTRDLIYLSDFNKGEIHVLDHTLKEIDFICYREHKKTYLSEFLDFKPSLIMTKILVDQKTGIVYLAEQDSHLLYVIK